MNDWEVQLRERGARVLRRAGAEAAAAAAAGPPGPAHAPDFAGPVSPPGRVPPPPDLNAYFQAMVRSPDERSGMDAYLQERLSEAAQRARPEGGLDNTMSQMAEMRDVFDYLRGPMLLAAAAAFRLRSLDAVPHFPVNVRQWASADAGAAGPTGPGGGGAAEKARCEPEDSDDGEDVCSICLEKASGADSDMEAVHPWTGAPHLFHTKCIHQWLLDHTTCPVCRLEIRRADV